MLITHDNGGGVETMIRRRREQIRAEGPRPILVRPTEAGCRIVSDAAPPLHYRLPEEWPALTRMLVAQNPLRVEVHHRLGHHPDIATLAARLGIPQDIWVHDYASFCPRIDLIGVGDRYCGEPAAQETCVACIDQTGSRLVEPIGVAALRARSAGEFAAARRIVVPTADVARRLPRHFSGLRERLVLNPWDDILPRPMKPDRQATQGRRRICVIGAIGADKGLAVLLACARDAADRDLGLEFRLVGISSDDAALLATGRVWITGRYRPAETIGLIRRQRADLAFVPSIWPETWCFALSHAWEAGLPAVAFDLGGPAERIRASQGRGGAVLPLNLPPAAINQSLLAISIFD